MSLPKVFPTLEDINKVGDFARKYTWNINFENGFNNFMSSVKTQINNPLSGTLFGSGGVFSVDIPQRFTEWFPVENCSISINSTDSFDVQGGVLGTQIPKQQQTRTLSITLFDTYAYDFSVWMYNWRRQIINIDGGWVLPVMDACCQCNIICYDSVGKHIHTGIYYVYPTDQQQAQFDSGGDAYQFDSEFVIAGTQEELFEGTMKNYA